MHPFNIKHYLVQLIFWSICLGLITFVCHHPVLLLDNTLVAMLYLLAVLFAAYFSSMWTAVYVSITSFLLINYFFVEPKYTFQVANLQSWLLLLIFLVVALIVSSSIKQLKDQKMRAEKSSEQAQFLQSIAQTLAAQSNSQAILEAGCTLIQKELGVPLAIAEINAHHKSHTILYRTAEFPIQESSLRSAIESARMIGAGTSDWPEMQQWVIPFGNFQSPAHALIIDHPPIGNLEWDKAFVSLVSNQFADAYFRTLNQERLIQAETMAKEEHLRKTLLASLSHDMRTPLTTIVGSVNTLIDPEIILDTSQQNELLHSIKAESEYLAQASENVLALTKLNAHTKAVLNMDWQLPEEIIGNVVRRYQSRIERYPIVFSMRCNNAFIKADALLVAQSVANLIDNAIKWHHGDHPIEIHLDKKNEYVTISVTNQGDGFPNDFHIEPFKKHSTSRGFGLGLAIVQAIVEAHQGQLSIESQPSIGATVTLYFPTQTPPEIA